MGFLEETEQRNINFSRRFNKKTKNALVSSKKCSDYENQGQRR